MINSKLVSILKTLSPTEMKELKDYINSPFFNKNRKVVALFDHIRKFYPDFSNNSLTDQSISAVIFPGMKHDYFKIRNLTSDLFSLAKDFLAHLYYRDESVYYPAFLLEKLREKKLYVIADQSMKSFKKEMATAKILDEFFLLKQSELSQQEHFRQIVKDPLDSFEYFQNDFDNFLEYALLRLLKFYSIMIHDKVQNNLEFNMKMFRQVLEFVQDPSNLKNPTLIIYSRIVFLVLEKDEQYFFELKMLRDKFSENLTREDRYMLDLYMSSFCAEVFNTSGKPDFQREHFLISKAQFDRDEMTIGRMLYPDFMIHVKIATRVNEFKWAEKFMEKYSEQLPEDDKDSCINFCNAYMSYYKGDFVNAMDLLSKTNFSKSLLKVQVRILLLQSYYELGYLDEMSSLLETFRKFLDRDRSVPDIYKNSFIEYLKIVGELQKLNQVAKGKEKNFRISLLKQETEALQSNLFGIKIWLREKLSKL